ncbi:hypothetical protein L596_001816 [Steinernema carpocapsae]|uniref:Nucleoprotein TPR n=1 Tax=Steinernema carpocapsae TaxID=34508 RepID=A0A4U8UQ18_STECR|nr:hypothetical protein L596_001816 [Steinernema carpocapsae]
MLTYILEKGDQPPDEVEDDLLFQNIDDLLETNAELREKLRSTQKELEDVQTNARDEAAQKNEELVQRYEGQVKLNTEQIRLLTINNEQLQEQVNKYKDLIALLPQAKNEATISGIELQELIGEKEKMTATYEAMRDRFDVYRQERVRSDQAYDQRMEQQIQLISELRAVKARLETEIMANQTNTTAVQNQIEQADKDIHTLRERLEKLRTEKAVVEQKSAQLGQALVNAQNEAGRAAAQVQQLQSELERERANVLQLDGELRAMQNSQDLNSIASTLAEMKNQMQSLSEERSDRSGTQVEALTVERDNLKLLLAQATEELKRSSTDRDLERQRFENQLEIANATRATAEQETLSLRNQTEAMKQKVAALEKKFTSAEKDGSQPASQQVLNRNAYLETQVRELEEKLKEAEVKLETKQKEADSLMTFTSNIETSLKDCDEFAVKERLLLQTQLDSVQSALSEARNLITSLRDKNAELQERCDKETNEFEQKKLAFRSQIMEYERRYAELEQMQMDATEHSTDLSNLQDRHQGVVKRLEEALIEKQTIENQNQLLVNQNKTLKTEMAKEKEASTKKIDSLRALARKYKEQNTSRTQDDETLAAEVTQAQYDELRRERDELAANFERMKADFDEERDELQMRLSALKSISGMRRNEDDEDMSPEPELREQLSPEVPSAPGPSNEAVPSVAPSFKASAIVSSSAEPLPSSSTAISAPSSIEPSETGFPEPAELRQVVPPTSSSQIADISQSSSGRVSESQACKISSSSGRRRVLSIKRRHPDVDDFARREGDEDSIGDSNMNILAEAAMRKRYRSSPTEVSTSSEVAVPAAIPEEAEELIVEDDDEEEDDEADSMPDNEEDSRDAQLDSGAEDLPQVGNIHHPEVIDLDDDEEEEAEDDEGENIVEPRDAGNLPEDELDEDDYDDGRDDQMNDFDDIEDDEDDYPADIDVHFEPNAHGYVSASHHRGGVPAEPVVYDVLDSSDDDDFGRPGGVAYEPADSGTQSNQGPLEDDDNPEDPSSSPSHRIL